MVVVLLFASMFLLVLWTSFAVFGGNCARTLVRTAYSAGLLIAASVAAYSTFFYDYFPDPNTHVVGWPIPTIIFQRDDANSPWLDFVGPTVIFAYPMNFALFMFLPCVVFLNL